MTDTPMIKWVAKAKPPGEAWMKAWDTRPEFHADLYAEYIPRAEADAMVAAVVDSCAEVLEECGIDGSAFAQTFEEYRRGRAAFEKAVQEAVEAERERCAQVALRHFGYEPSEEEMHTVMDIAAAIRSQHEPSE